MDLPFDLREGDGAVRAWVDAGRPARRRHGGPGPACRAPAPAGRRPELQLNEIEGRVELSRVRTSSALGAPPGFVSGDGIVVAALGLGCQPADGAAHGVQASAEVLGGEVNAQRLDFALMAQIAQRLPLGERSYHLLASLQPEGVLTELHGSWLGPLEAPRQYRVAAHLEGLALRPAPCPPGSPGPPGGARRQPAAGGHRARPGAAGRGRPRSCPASLKTPLLPIHELQTRLHWRIPAGRQAGRLRVRAARLEAPDPGCARRVELRWHRARDRRPRHHRPQWPARRPGCRARLGRATCRCHCRRPKLPDRALLAGRPGRQRAFSARWPSSCTPRRQCRCVPSCYQARARPSAWPMCRPRPTARRATGHPSSASTASSSSTRGGMQIRNARARMLGYEVSGVNGGIAHFGAKAQLQLDGQGRASSRTCCALCAARRWTAGSRTRSGRRGQRPSTLKLGVQIPLGGAPPGTANQGPGATGRRELRLRPDVPHLGDARARRFDERSVQLSGGTPAAGRRGQHRRWQPEGRQPALRHPGPGQQRGLDARRRAGPLAQPPAP